MLGEFGGLGLPLEGHLWGAKRNWGYRTYRTREELANKYEQLMRQLLREYSRGLAAAVYTQVTDVEGEVNGLLTYDRKLCKLDPAKLCALHAPFFSPPPIIVTRTLLASCEKAAQNWRYRFDAPRGDWFALDFDASAWSEGPGGFGTKGTPGAIVRTEWNSSEIWLRRSFELPELGELHGPELRIHHDEDVTLYLNGQRLTQLRGYTTGYIDLPLASLFKHLRQGRNVLALHCKQTGGGQYIDVGIVDVEAHSR